MDIAANDQKLNEMILTGQALEGFDLFYADDVVMQENSDEPRAGKAVNRQFEVDFFASIAEWKTGQLVASAVNGDTSFSQWYMEIVFKNGYLYKSSQVAVRKWNEQGQIVHERFFYNKG